MAMENKDFLIFAVFFTVLLSLGFAQMGNEIKNNRTLDQKSIDYLEDFSNQSRANGLNDLDTSAKNLDKKSNPLLDKVGELPVVSDILGAINFFKEKTAFIWTFVSTIFNIPTFLISSLGLDVGAFSVYLNITGGVLFIWALLYLIGKVK